MPALRPLALLAACAVLTLGAATHAPSPATQLHARLAGRWTGTLRYRDYQDSARFVTLPTELEGTLASDSTWVRLDFTYDDGPGKTVRDRDRFELDAAARVIRWGTEAKGNDRARYDVTARAGGEGATPLTLTFERDGQDDNRPARLREQLTLSTGELVILKEVRFGPAAPWLFRHEYRFRRVR
jgi:hypothetical protein